MAIQRKNFDDNASEDRNSFLSIDRKIPITMIFALMLQFAGLLWGASSVYTTQQLVNQKLELTLSSIEDRLAGIEKVTFTVSEAETLRQQLEARLSLIEKDINRIDDEINTRTKTSGTRSIR